MLGHDIDGASLFNNAPPRQQHHCYHAVALPHAAGFPDLEVLRRLRHDPAPSVSVAPAHRPAGCRTGRATPDRFPRSLRISTTASAPSSTPAASPRTAHRSLGPGLRPLRSAVGEERPSDRALSSTAKRPIHQIRQAADDSRGFNHWFCFLTPIPSSLAGTDRLVVSVRPYVVEAASGLTPDLGISLPPASTGHCDDQRWAPPPTRFLSASWRTPELVQIEHTGGEADAAGEELRALPAIL